MIEFIADKFYYLFLGLIILSLVQRRKGRGNIKRTATVFQAILVFILYIGAMVIQEEGFEKKWIVIPLAVVALALYFFRPRILPYKLHCRNCGARLNATQIFMHDSNLCSNCDPDDQGEEAIAEEQEDQESSSDTEPEGESLSAEGVEQTGTVNEGEKS